MKEKHFSIKVLARNMIEKTEDFDIVYAVLFYNEAKKLLRELLAYDSVSVKTITLEDPWYDGYEKEYYVSLSGDSELRIEKAYHEANVYHDAKYYTIGDAYVYIDEDANSSIVCQAVDCVFAQLKISGKMKDDDDMNEFDHAAEANANFDNFERDDRFVLCEYI